MKYSITAFLYLTLLLISCNSITDNPSSDYREANEKEILKYVKDKDLTVQKSESGLYYTIENPGTGKQPVASDNVTVAYKGYFSDGKVFDESEEKGISFNLQQVIQGWTEGIPYFKEGGSGILLIPSHLGYGSTDNRSIPGGSVLIFDITLITVN